MGCEFSYHTHVTWISCTTHRVFHCHVHKSVSREGLDGMATLLSFRSVISVVERALYWNSYLVPLVCLHACNLVEHLPI